MSCIQGIHGSSLVCHATYAAHDSEEPDASIFRVVKTVIAS